jgi:hypothetical protein
MRDLRILAAGVAVFLSPRLLAAQATPPAAGDLTLHDGNG